MVAELEFRGVGLVSLIDTINATSTQGRLVFDPFAALTEFERDIFYKRTKAGFTVAWARGWVAAGGGFPKKLSARPSSPRRIIRNKNWG